jgi:tetratricopeptide (TPR) repeat protein
MDFLEVLDQVVDLLRQRRRLTYRTIKLQFNLDDEYLDALKDELIKGQRLAADEGGEVLVWTEGTEVIPTPASAPTIPSEKQQEHPPISYTPQHLAERILSSRSALEGERKQVTVCFADIKDSTELIRDLDPEAAQLGHDPILEPIKALLIERTQGNPFFLEEMVRTLVETEVLAGEPGGYRLLSQMPSIQVPDTVQAILAARIDRLSPDDKQLLQTAAVIANEVPWPLLQAIVELPEDTLHRSLAHLQAAEFVYETQLFPERQYTFKHALTHEVAYGSSLHERRCMLHARITEALEAIGSDRLSDHSEQLAHHAFRGELWDKAVRYYRQSGARAQAQSAYREAVMCYEQALAALQHLPENPTAMEQGIDLRLEMRNALYPLADFDRILSILREAERLAEALDDPHRLCRVCAFVAMYCMQMGEHERAIMTGERALTLARTLGDFTLEVQANFGLGIAYFFTDSYHKAIAASKWMMMSLSDQQTRDRFGLAYLPSVACRDILSRCLAEQGAFAEAIACGEEDLSLAEVTDRPIDFAVAYRGLGQLHLLRGDLNTAMSVFERGPAICETAEIPRTARAMRNFVAYTYALAGRHDDALPLLERSVDEMADTSRGVPNQALHPTWLSEAYLLAGGVQDATPAAIQALEIAEARQEWRAQAWVLRLGGEIAYIAMPLSSNGPKPTTGKPSTWPRNLACVPSRPFATVALEPYIARQGNQNKPVPT